MGWPSSRLAECWWSVGGVSSRPTRDRGGDGHGGGDQPRGPQDAPGRPPWAASSGWVAAGRPRQLTAVARRGAPRRGRRKTIQTGRPTSEPRASMAHDVARKTFCKPDGQDDPAAVRGLRRSETRLWATHGRRWGASVANGCGRRPGWSGGCPGRAGCPATGRPQSLRGKGHGSRRRTWRLTAWPRPRRWVTTPSGSRLPPKRSAACATER